MKRDARNGRDGVLRGTPSTVATVATVAERKRWGGILPPHHQGGCPILEHPKSIRGCRDSRHPMPRNRTPGTGEKSVRRTRSHRMKFCVQKGLGGRCPQQADGRKCECVLTLALLAGFVCGYPHTLLACI